MKKYSENAFFPAINLIKWIRYFEEEYDTCNQVIMTEERERYIHRVDKNRVIFLWESDYVHLALGLMKWQKHPLYP